MSRSLLLLLLVLLPAAPAASHQWTKPDGTKIDARWIMNSPKYFWCCGPQDCEPVPGRVSWTPTGWVVKGIKGVVSEGDTFRSIDGQPWACRRTFTNEIRCLFLPRPRN